ELSCPPTLHKSLAGAFLLLPLHHYSGKARRGGRRSVCGEMEVALGSAASLLGKVLRTLSDSLVAVYVDSLQLGHNSEQIKDKLLHAQGLLHNAQGSHVCHSPGLQGLLEKLSRDADQAEDLLDELHYFQIHDRLHGTHYATTQEAGVDGLRHQALHAGTALRHTLVRFFYSSRTPKT
uniref:Rx N-terminal domain-containing protein n=1 Tax=Aegilops tauschii subsp. strangulata TaxID=200361 RepID=A0A453MIY2_AEGTS